LIIVDLTLPGLDGYQFCRQLKRKPAYQNVKVFAIADGVTSVDVALICEARPDGVAWKPPSPAAMRETVYAMLGVGGAGGR